MGLGEKDISSRPPSKSGRQKQDQAEALALQGLAKIAAEERLSAWFLGQSGLTVADLRDKASDPGLLAGVLEFFLSDDQVLLAFCEEAQTTPEAVHRAAHTLQGGFPS